MEERAMVDKRINPIRDPEIIDRLCKELGHLPLQYFDGKCARCGRWPEDDQS